MNRPRPEDEDKKQNEYKHILEELLKRPENKYCADCRSAAPRWASATLGVFLCMKCSGIHRGLSTDVSFVRSVTLDKWNPKYIENMRNMGNARAASIWEANVPKGYPRPSAGDQIGLEKWIKDKYELRRFYKAPEPTPKTSSNPASTPAPTPIVAKPAPTPSLPQNGSQNKSAPAPQISTFIITPINEPLMTNAAPSEADDFGEFTAPPNANLLPSSGPFQNGTNPASVPFQNGTNPASVPFQNGTNPASVPFQNGTNQIPIQQPAIDTKKNNILSLFDLQHPQQQNYQNHYPPVHQHAQQLHIPPHQIQMQQSQHAQHAQHMSHNYPNAYHPQYNMFYNNPYPPNHNGNGHAQYPMQQQQYFPAHGNTQVPNNPNYLQYNIPQQDHMDNLLLHKINSMGQERRRQDFAVFDAPRV